MRWAVACVAMLWIGCALIVQQPGCSENGHYALLRSLADGSPSIDRYHWWTCDVSWYHGHYYTAKGPGLAAAALPVLAVVRAVSSTGDEPPHQGPPLAPAPKRALWPFAFALVLSSGIGLFLLARVLAEAVAPGTGTAVASTLFGGTMLLPYSTLFASHVPAAFLGTAAFVLLFRERRRPAPSTLALAVGGLLAGAAIVVEPPMGLVTIGLLGYALVRSRRWPRAIAYIAGAAAGVLPLLVFDHWAFGSVGHTPYSDTVAISGDTGHDQLGANTNGFFGILLPSANVGARLLLLNKGLLVATPIVAAAAVGLWWLIRERVFRAEALLIGGLATAYLLYNAAYYQPYGGDSAGPRFLLPLLPFLALPLPLVLRRFPGVFAALAAVSIGTMFMATITFPMLDGDDTKLWFSRAFHGRFQETLLGTAGWAMAPTIALFAAALATAAFSAPRPWLTRSDVICAAIALLGWGVAGSTAPPLLHSDLPAAVSTVAAVGIAGTVLGLAVVAMRRAVRRQLPASTTS